MATKRFEFYEDEFSIIKDNLTNAEYGEFDTDMETICSILNEQNETIAELRKENYGMMDGLDCINALMADSTEENEGLKCIIAFADKLIEDLGSDEMKRQWREYNESE